MLKNQFYLVDIIDEDKLKFHKHYSANKIVNECGHRSCYYDRTIRNTCNIYVTDNPHPPLYTSSKQTRLAIPNLDNILNATWNNDKKLNVRNNISMYYWSSRARPFHSTAQYRVTMDMTSPVVDEVRRPPMSVNLLGLISVVRDCYQVNMCTTHDELVTQVTQVPTTIRLFLADRSNYLYSNLFVVRCWEEYTQVYADKHPKQLNCSSSMRILRALNCSILP